jgi:transcriptional regulator with XRE-family HTH domain
MTTEVCFMARGPLPPLIYKIMCGRKLEAARERAQLYQEEVAERLGWSQQKVANGEIAVSAVNLRDLELLLDLYGVDGSARSEYIELSGLARKQLPRRKGTLRSMFEGSMRHVVDMEASAATTWRHNSMMIPGLLQTEEYMRFIFRAYRPSPTREQIDQFVGMRLGRQKVLGNPDQHFWFVINEYALHILEDVDGGRSIMRGQIAVLLDAIDRPNVEVQVAPARSGYYPGQAETYEIYRFDTEPAVQVTYVEKYDGGDILHDEKNLSRFVAFWEQARGHALGPEQTRTFLEELSRP